jgi:hypothetical protein
MLSVNYNDVLIIWKLELSYIVGEHIGERLLTLIPLSERFLSLLLIRQVSYPHSWSTFDDISQDVFLYIPLTAKLLEEVPIATLLVAA